MPAFAVICAWPGATAWNPASVIPRTEVAPVSTIDIKTEGSLDLTSLQAAMPAFACSMASSFWPTRSEIAWSFSVTETSKPRPAEEPGSGIGAGPIRAAPHAQSATVAAMPINNVLNSRTKRARRCPGNTCEPATVGDVGPIDRDNIRSLRW